MKTPRKKKPQAELEQEFDKLYLEYEKIIYNLALRMTGDRDAADEVLQKTFLTLYVKISKVIDHPQPGGWLVKTAYYYIKHYEREQAYRWQHEASIEVAERRDV